MSQNNSRFVDDVQKLSNYCCSTLDFDNLQSDENYGYSSLVLCIIDAIFSIGVTYTSTRNTVQRFMEYFDTQTNLSVRGFVQLYQEHSIEFMADNVFQNKQRTSTRNGILKAEAILRVAEVLLKYDVNHIEDINSVVNQAEFETDFKAVRGQSSGISLRYFYMLAGVKDEIKPDRMIIQYISSCLERRVKVDECHSLLVNVCNQLNLGYPDLTPRHLDSLIWNYQRSQ